MWRDLDRAQAAQPRRLHLHFSDRLWASDPAAAARRVEALARRHPLTVTLHDLPQPSDGDDSHRRRADCYRHVIAAARGVVCNSHWEAGLVAALPAGTGRGAQRGDPAAGGSGRGGRGRFGVGARSACSASSIRARATSRRSTPPPRWPRPVDRRSPWSPSAPCPPVTPPPPNSSARTRAGAVSRSRSPATSPRRRCSAGPGRCSSRSPRIAICRRRVRSAVGWQPAAGRW